MILFLLSCTFDGLDKPVEYSETRQTIALTSEQPIFQEHPEAEDLNPEPNIFQMNLTAARKQHEIVDWTRDETIVVDGYAYNDLLPGPTIRVKIGDRVIIAFQNDLDAPSTIHWHGLQVPEDMDGVPWNRDPVMPESHIIMNLQWKRRVLFGIILISILNTKRIMDSMVLLLLRILLILSHVEFH